MPVGFWSPKDELPNPKALAPLFPNKLEESGEIKVTCEAHNTQHSVPHLIAGSGEKETPSTSPVLKHRKEHLAEVSCFLHLFRGL